MMRELRLAVMLLTRLPAGRMEVAPAMGACVWAYPLVGALVGAIAALAFGLFDVPPLAAALLAVAAAAAATGALHEDGLADTADGLWGGRDAARRLEIMRDSRIGTYGALALMLAVGLQAALIDDAAALIAIGAISRCWLPLLMWTQPQARPDGFGAAAVRGIDGARVAWSAGIGAVLGLLLIPRALLVMLVVLAVQWGLAAVARRRIGGLTGDILGAAQVLGTIAAWIVLA